MKKIALFVCMIALSIRANPGVATASGPLDEKPDRDRAVASAHPYLVSASVANLDTAVRWYTEVLGFREVRRLNLPEHALRISFVELSGFRLELIESKGSVSLSSIQSKFPEVSDRAKVQGFGKLAFTVASIETLATWLKSQKVSFVRDVTLDQETGEKWLIIEDMDGNWLQFFEARK